MTSLPSFQSAFFLIGDEQGITIARLTKPQLTEDENLEQLEQDLNALFLLVAVQVPDTLLIDLILQLHHVAFV